MKGIWKKTLSVCLALGTAATMAACSQNGSGTSGSVKTLSLLMYTDWYKSGWKALEQYINTHTSETGFKLDIQKIAGGSQGDQVVETKFASGNLPDLVESYNPLWIQAHANGLGKLVDLTGISSTSEYDSSILKSTYIIDSKLYGMPIDSEVIQSCFFYNKKAFSAAGITGTPTTWDELLDDCAKLKAKGITPVYFSAKDAWTVQPLSFIGTAENYAASGKTDFSDYLKELNTNKLKYSQISQMEDLLSKGKDLIQKGYVNATYLSDTYDNAQTALANGTAGMYPLGTWVLDQLVTKYPDQLGDIGVFATPGSNGVVLRDDPYSVSLTTSCKDQALGKKAVDFIASQKAQQVYADAQPGIYLNRQINVSNLSEPYKEAQKFITDGKTVLDFSNLVTYAYGDFSQDVLSYYTGILKSPSDVTKALDDETAKNAKSKSDPNWK